MVDIMKNCIIVFDGGSSSSSPIVSPKNVDWHSTRVDNGGLIVCHPPHPTIGLTFFNKNS